jgi:hypothetical protein
MTTFPYDLSAFDWALLAAAAAAGIWNGTAALSAASTGVARFMFAAQFDRSDQPIGYMIVVFARLILALASLVFLWLGFQIARTGGL